MKNSNDSTGDRTRDLPTSSAVPQPTAPPHTPIIYSYKIIFLFEIALTLMGFTYSKVSLKLCAGFYKEKQTEEVGQKIDCNCIPQ